MTYLPGSSRHGQLRRRGGRSGCDGGVVRVESGRRQAEKLTVGGWNYESPGGQSGGERNSVAAIGL